MKKWKSSKGLKTLMAVVSVLMVASIAVSSAAIMFMAECGIYSKPRKTVLDDLYDDYSFTYSVMAIANRESDTMKEELNKTNFRYGIIKAEDIEQVDITDPGNYLYYNFGTMPEADALKEETAGVYSFEIGPGVHYSWDCTLFGGANVWDEGYDMNDSAQLKETKELEITGIYYNTVDGMFYYETEEGFFRVQSVQLPLSTTGELITFEYDSGQKAYYNPYPNTCLVQDYYVTFNKFDITSASWQTWNEIYLNGNLYMHTDIRFVTDEYTYMNELQGKPIVEKYYTYDGGAFLSVYSDFTEEADTSVEPARERYNVIYQVNEPLQATGLRFYGSMFDGDLYEQAGALVNLCYYWRYTVIGILVLSFIFWVVSTVLLLVMAGHRGSYEAASVEKEDNQRDISEEENEWQEEDTKRRFVDKVCAGFWQKIWFDLETVAAFLIGGTGLVLLDEIFRDIVFPRTFILALLVGVAEYILCLFWLTDFVIRIKLGKWWRNTLIYMVLSCICRWLRKYTKKAVRFFQENLSLVGKTLCVLLVLSLAEFFVIMVTSYDTAAEVLIWFIYRGATVVLALLAIVQAKQLKEAAVKIAAGNIQEKVKTEKMFWEFKKHGETLNSISDGINLAVEKRMQSEHFRTELITNVSHDIKTPLTSIINYVDLLQKENIDNENAREYLEVLSRQSARLKKLTEDLVEASKASTGSMPVNMEKLELGVFLTQTLGEFKEKLEEAGLRVVMHKPETEVNVKADGRHLWRVVENLVQNICKYAQPSTRVYIDLEDKEQEAVISFKNISGYELNIQGEELMERFVRGDVSRHTEGSGLGLSIAGSLMELMGGKLEIVVDGDLFKVILHFVKEA